MTRKAFRDFTPDLADLICSQIAAGSNLNKICELDEMPDRVTVYRWLRIHESFRINYACAREDRADWRADRIDKICAKVEAGELDANAARVIIDAEKWQAGKERPKFYGDRIENRLADPDGNALKITVTGIRPTEDNT